MRPTFLNFYTAQKALNASQAALSVTGQNISNVNTSGYTRQRVDLYSSSSSTGSTLYSQNMVSNVGSGVDIIGFSQYRDPYLDIRFRGESSKLGEIDAKLSFLSDLEKIFDEISVDGIHTQLQEFKDTLQSLAGEAGSPEFEAIVKSSAQNLIKLFNQYSTQVENVFNQQMNDLDNASIEKVNTLLSNIAILNENIKENQLFGNSSLELLDQRNQMIDELSQYMNIKVTVTSEKISDKVSVDNLSITLSDGTVLLDNGKYSKISRNDDFESIGDKLSINLTYPHNSTEPAKDITSSITSGTLKGFITMFNSSGEFDTPPNTDRGINYYNQLLDSLAFEFANAFNNANSFDGTEPNCPDDPADYDRPLFSSKDGEKITAGNIQLSEDWLNNIYGITNSKTDNIDGTDGTGKNDNILHIITLFDKKITHTSESGTTIFNGTFEEFFSNMSTTLGLEKNSAEKVFKNYYSVLSDIDNSRASISSVSLDEEGINMLKYQKSYNAAARLMTTLDEALDIIINKMGIVGR